MIWWGYLLALVATVRGADSVGQTLPASAGTKGVDGFLPRSHDRRTGPQTVTRLAGQRVAGDKGCGWILPKGHDRRTGSQTVTRFAGQRQ